MNKNFFQFAYFSDLQVGDVFKFSPQLDDTTPDKFYSVYAKNEKTTSINTAYGPLTRYEMKSNSNREVKIYPERKR